MVTPPSMKYPKRGSEVLIKLKRFVLEIDGQFVKLGRLEFWLERSGYRPAGLLWGLLPFEIIRRKLGEAEVFAMGRRLQISRFQLPEMQKNNTPRRAKTY
jgi:hypothetical protein